MKIEFDRWCSFAMKIGSWKAAGPSSKVCGVSETLLRLAAGTEPLQLHHLEVLLVYKYMHTPNV